METITNAANAASKAIWGDSTKSSSEEPVSGETGSGTAAEPYDKGNLEGMHLALYTLARLLP
jgi:hypothetical protein